MKQLRHRSSAFLLTLTTICLVFLLLVPSGCGKKADKPEIKEESKEAVKQKETPRPAETKETGSPANFVHTSDIHFNPFYDTTLVAQLVKAPADQWESIFQTSRIKDYSEVNKSDTNYPLFMSALENMAKMAGKIDFIIITGDLLVHEFNDKFSGSTQPGDDLHSFINKTVGFISSMIKKYFPGTPVYFSLGNNDCYSGDYKLIPDGDFLHNTAPILSANFLYSEANKSSFASTYPVGGYYSVTPPGLEKMRILTLNSIFFSEKRPQPTPDDAAYKELQWFEEQLKAARENNLKVWITMHIPPGANVYSSVSDKTYKPMWYDEYNTRFIGLLDQYAPEITAGFAGHTHMDDWRLLMSSQTPGKAISYMHIGPAISPLFGNNSGFLVVNYDRAPFTVKDYTAYWINLEAENPEAQPWQKEYSFGTAYGQTEINPSTLLAFYNGINSDPQTREKYMTYYNVSDKKYPVITDANWKYYWCGIGNWTSAAFEACAPAAAKKSD